MPLNFKPSLIKAQLKWLRSQICFTCLRLELISVEQKLRISKMSLLLEFILVTIVSFLNFLDKSLQVFGIKLLRMDKESMMKRLSPELQEETKSKDIALPWDLFMKGMENDKMMDFWRRVETSRQLKNILQNRINIRKALQINPAIQQVLLHKSICILIEKLTNNILKWVSNSMSNFILLCIHFYS